jgi:hypothetical protein
MANISKVFGERHRHDGLRHAIRTCGSLVWPPHHQTLLRCAHFVLPNLSGDCEPIFPRPSWWARSAVMALRICERHASRSGSKPRARSRASFRRLKVCGLLRSQDSGAGGVKPRPLRSAAIRSRCALASRTCAREPRTPAGGGPWLVPGSPHCRSHVREESRQPFGVTQARTRTKRFTRSGVIRLSDPQRA